jgi:hypothetical protein
MKFNLSLLTRMSSHTERAFLIIPLIILFLVITYSIFAFYIIPEFYSNNQMYENILSYMLTASVTLVYSGTLIAQYLDLVSSKK